MTEEQQMEGLCCALQRLVSTHEGIEGMEPMAALSAVAGFVASVLLATMDGDKDVADELLRRTFCDMVSSYIENAHRKQ